MKPIAYRACPFIIDIVAAQMWTCSGHPSLWADDMEFMTYGADMHRYHAENEVMEQSYEISRKQRARMH